MMDDTDEDTFEAGWNARGPAIILDSRIAELTEQLHKSQAEVYRLMVVNQDLREWWNASSSAMRDKRREHLRRST